MCNCNEVPIIEQVINKTFIVPGEGKDGLTPYKGNNGNWWIGDTDTGEPVTATISIDKILFNLNSTNP